MERFAIKIDKNVRINLCKICRLCGIDNPEKIPILEENIVCHDGEPELCRKIFDCCGIQVCKNDKMPQSICTLCHDKISDFFEFREMCSATNTQTRKLLGLPDEPSKIKEDDEVRTECILGLENDDKNFNILPTGKKRGRKKADSIPKESVENFDVKDTKLLIEGNNKKKVKLSSGCASGTSVQSKIKPDPNVSATMRRNSQQMNLGIDIKTKLEKEVKVLGQRGRKFSVRLPISERKKNIKVETPKRGSESVRGGKRKKIALGKTPTFAFGATIKKDTVSNIDISRKNLLKNRKNLASMTLLAEKPPNKRERMREIEEKKNLKILSVDPPAAKKIKLMSDIPETPPSPKETCSICYREFNTFTQHQEHLYIDHVPNIIDYHCVQCNETILRKADIKNHNLFHKVSKTPFQCGRCTKPFYTRSAYTKHVQECITVASSDIFQSITCDKCLKVFETQNLFDWHSCIINKRECPKCQKKFTKKVGVFKHIVRCSVDRSTQEKIKSNDQPDQSVSSEELAEPITNMKPATAATLCQDNVELNISIKKEPDAIPKKSHETVAENVPFVVLAPAASTAMYRLGNSLSFDNNANDYEFGDDSFHNDSDDCSDQIETETNPPNVNIEKSLTVTKKVSTEKTKKAHRMRKKDMRRCEALLKDTYMTLVNIQQEPDCDSSSISSNDNDNPLQPIRIKEEVQDTGYAKYDKVVAANIKQEIPDEPQCIERFKPALKIKIKKEHGTLNSKFVSENNITSEESSPTKKKKKKKKRVFRIPLGLAAKIKQEKLDRESAATSMVEYVPECCTTETSDHMVKIVSNITIDTTEKENCNLHNMESTDSEINAIKIPIISCVAGGVSVPANMDVSQSTTEFPKDDQIQKNTPEISGGIQEPEDESYNLLKVKTEYFNDDYEYPETYNDDINHVEEPSTFENSTNYCSTEAATGNEFSIDIVKQEIASPRKYSSPAHPTDYNQNVSDIALVELPLITEKHSLNKNMYKIAEDIESYSNKIIKVEPEEIPPPNSTTDCGQHTEVNSEQKLRNIENKYSNCDVGTSSKLEKVGILNTIVQLSADSLENDREKIELDSNSCSTTTSQLMQSVNILDKVENEKSAKCIPVCYKNSENDVNVISSSTLEKLYTKPLQLDQVHFSNLNTPDSDTKFPTAEHCQSYNIQATQQMLKNVSDNEDNTDIVATRLGVTNKMVSKQCVPSTELEHLIRENVKCNDNLETIPEDQRLVKGKVTSPGNVLSIKSQLDQHNAKSTSEISPCDSLQIPCENLNQLDLSFNTGTLSDVKCESNANNLKSSELLEIVAEDSFLQNLDNEIETEIVNVSLHVQEALYIKKDQTTNNTQNTCSLKGINMDVEENLEINENDNNTIVLSNQEKSIEKGMTSSNLKKDELVSSYNTELQSQSESSQYDPKHIPTPVDSSKRDDDTKVDNIGDNLENMKAFSSNETEIVNVSLHVQEALYIKKDQTTNNTENTYSLKGINMDVEENLEINENDNNTIVLSNQEKSIEKGMTSSNLKKDELVSSYNTELQSQSESSQYDPKHIPTPVDSSKHDDDIKVDKIGDNLENIKAFSSNQNDQVHEFITDESNYARSNLEDVDNLKFNNQLESGGSIETPNSVQNVTVDENLESVSSDVVTVSTVSSIQALCYEENQQVNKTEDLKNNANVETFFETDSNKAGSTTCPPDSSDMQTAETHLEKLTPVSDIIDDIRTSSSTDNKLFVPEIRESSVEISENNENLERVKDATDFSEISHTENLKPVQLTNLSQTESDIQYESDACGIQITQINKDPTVEIKTLAPNFKSNIKTDEFENVAISSSFDIQMKKSEECNTVQNRDNSEDRVENYPEEQTITFAEQNPDNDNLESPKFVKHQIISSTIHHTQDLVQYFSVSNTATESQQELHIQTTEELEETLIQEQDYDTVNNENSVENITTGPPTEDQVFSTNAIIAHTDSVISYEMQVCPIHELNTNENKDETIIDKSIKNNFALEVENTENIAGDEIELLQKNQSTSSIKVEILKNASNPTSINIENSVYTSGVIRENPMKVEVFDNVKNSIAQCPNLIRREISTENKNSYNLEDTHMVSKNETKIQEPDSVIYMEENEPVTTNEVAETMLISPKSMLNLDNIPKLKSVMVKSLNDDRSTTIYGVQNADPIINKEDQLNILDDGAHTKDSEKADSKLRTMVSEMGLDIADNENLINYQECNNMPSEKRESCISEIHLTGFNKPISVNQNIDKISSDNNFKPTSTIIRNSLNDIKPSSSNQCVIIGESSVIKYSSSIVQYTDSQKDLSRSENIIELSEMLTLPNVQQSELEASTSQYSEINKNENQDLLKNISPNKNLLNINILPSNKSIEIESGSISMERLSSLDPVIKQRPSIIQNNEFSECISDGNYAKETLNENKIKRDVVIFTTTYNTDRFHKIRPIHKSLADDFDIDDMNDSMSNFPVRDEAITKQTNTSITCDIGPTNKYDLIKSKEIIQESSFSSDTDDLNHQAIKSLYIQPTHDDQSANETETETNLDISIRSNRYDATDPVELDYRENEPYYDSKNTDNNLLQQKSPSHDHLESDSDMLTDPSHNKEIQNFFNIDNEEQNVKDLNETPRNNSPVPSTSTSTTCINIENVNEIAENNNNANLEKQLQNEMELDNVSSESNEDNFNEEEQN